MQLGIVVVYMVSDGQEELLGLHLRSVERHTSVPHTIYGSSNRLPARIAAVLRRHSGVKLYELRPTDLRGGLEHSHYLEQLVTLAIDDGASHVVILHVDSFPVDDGWVEALVGKLSDTCVLVTTDGVSTACLLFHRDFYVAHQPRLLSGEEMTA